MLVPGVMVIFDTVCPKTHEAEGEGVALGDCEDEAVCEAVDEGDAITDDVRLTVASLLDPGDFVSDGDDDDEGGRVVVDDGEAVIDGDADADTDVLALAQGVADIGQLFRLNVCTSALVSTVE